MTRDTTPDTAPPRIRMTGDERRAAILAAAQHEFARNGFDGASTASIARAAECSEPMLYKHFANKQALFVETILHATAGIERQFDALFDAPGDLLDHWSASLPLIMADPEYAEVMQLRKLAVINADIEGVRPALDAIQQRHLQRVSDGLARAKAEGHVRDDVDPAYVAWMWQGIVFAGCYREALESGGFHAMLPFAERFIDSLRISAST